MCRGQEHGGRRCPTTERTREQWRAASRRYYQRGKSRAHLALLPAGYAAAVLADDATAAAHAANNVLSGGSRDMSAGHLLRAVNEAPPVMTSLYRVVPTDGGDPQEAASGLSRRGYRQSLMVASTELPELDDDPDDHIIIRIQGPVRALPLEDGDTRMLTGGMFEDVDLTQDENGRYVLTVRQVHTPTPEAGWEHERTAPAAALFDAVTRACPGEDNTADGIGSVIDAASNDGYTTVDTDLNSVDHPANPYAYDDPDEDRPPALIDSVGLARWVMHSEDSRWVGDYTAAREVRRAAAAINGDGPTALDPHRDAQGFPTGSALVVDPYEATRAAVLMHEVSRAPVREQVLYRATFMRDTTPAGVVEQLRAAGVQSVALLQVTDLPALAEEFAHPEGHAGTQVVYRYAAGARALAGMRLDPAEINRGGGPSGVMGQEFTIGGRFEVTSVAVVEGRVVVDVQQVENLQSPLVATVA